MKRNNIDTLSNRYNRYNNIDTLSTYKDKKRNNIDTISKLLAYVLKS